MNVLVKVKFSKTHNEKFRKSKGYKLKGKRHVNVILEEPEERGDHHLLLKDKVHRPHTIEA